MLTRLIVSSFSMLVEVCLWLLLAIGMLAGLFLGWTNDGAIASIVGAIIGTMLAFMFEVLFFGAVLIIDDIRGSVREIQALKSTQ